jgi:hypothetical protein
MAPSIYENASVEVLLRGVTQHFILAHHAFVDFSDAREFFVR